MELIKNALNNTDNRIISIKFDKDSKVIKYWEWIYQEIKDNTKDSKTIAHNFSNRDKK